MSDKKSLHIKSKFWIELDEEVIFGLGRIKIFEAIEKTGSLSQAAAHLGMSYRAAWGKVKATEERLQLTLVESRQGNRQRGTTLTPAGVELLKQYSEFQTEAYQLIDNLFEEHFGELLDHIIHPKAEVEKAEEATLDEMLAAKKERKK